LAVVAACGNQAPTAPTPPVFTPVVLPPVPAGLPQVLTTMLSNLLAEIGISLADNRAILPNNPQSAALITARIAMLESPTLGVDIINRQQWIHGESSGGHRTPIGLVFALESMRSEAGEALDHLTRVLPVLDDFFGQPFPRTTLQVWYGFVIGNRGGSGLIRTEDRTTYQSRGAPLPYNAVLGHEAAHTYIRNEALTQFLEMYVHNTLSGLPADASAWTYTRGWTPGSSSNTASAALVDVFQLIGDSAMRAAYRAVLPFGPAYGSPLSATVIDAFVAQVPPGLQEQVRAKLATIIA
jgi:hypothetical protein